MDGSTMERRARLVRAQRLVGIAAFTLVGPLAFFRFLGLFDPSWRNADSSIDGYELGSLVFGGVISPAFGAAVALYSRAWVEYIFDRKVEAVRAEERLDARQRNAQRVADQRRRMRG